jgi:hypothetical protein
VVVDAREAQVFEGGLAQILNEALQCCFSCHRAGLDFKKEIADLGARHQKGAAFCSKCLRHVDFRVIRQLA